MFNDMNVKNLCLSIYKSYVSSMKKNQLFLPSEVDVENVLEIIYEDKNQEMKLSLLKYNSFTIHY